MRRRCAKTAERIGVPLGAAILGDLMNTALNGAADFMPLIRCGLRRITSCHLFSFLLCLLLYVWLCLFLLVPAYGTEMAFYVLMCR